MPLKHNWRDFQLYVITAGGCHPGRELVHVMEETLKGGAGMLQLRNKTGSRQEVLREAKELRALTRAYDVPFIVNDYPDIALEVDADGVHLGQDDQAIEEARRLLGQDKIIGISTHSLEQGLAAERAGADYIGVGPVFPTNTKPGRAAVTTSYVSEAARHIRIPFVAIGGITLDNVGEVLAAGARKICAVSAIVGSEDPARVCRSFLEAIRSAEAGGHAIRIRLNGKETTTSAGNVAELVEQLGQGNKRLVAEVNGMMIQRSDWTSAALTPGARVELIQFVGGG
ncbi:thiamine phosphate synthase [Paenibacillus nanensis]|uniref:Thiamine-phosphate synthase n=1 Tax=Paenibacillus nanensis TaxID=393251 RepID=A0A3A1UVX7_9BACL|nr:thiamine phosphate synthase [Paenibacillus nanensis]